MGLTRVGLPRWAAVVTAAAVATALAVIATPANASQPQLTRYPYLTDAVTTGATLNWATDQSQTTGYATYGAVGTEACTAHRANGSKTGITVGSRVEYQWKAKITDLLPATRYCYRVWLGQLSGNLVDLLGNDPSPQFWSQVAAGPSAPFSFAVIGDWGSVDANGQNPNQANLMTRIAASGARFMLGAGDTAYNSGSQTNYGDLFQTGSTVFGPNFYKNVGDVTPMFNALGNHGRTATFLNVWPQPTAPVLSGGRYQMETYCCLNGTASANYPSAWYAFDAGPTRIYVLDATWSNGNVGTADIFKNDHDYHWCATCAEYQWLASDLAAHPSAIKFAVLHFPMYSDNATETTDPWMHGSGSVAQLFAANGVKMVFNGHAHIYQRNLPQPGEGFVSYVTGGGGATLEPIGAKGCGSYDAFGIGWSYSKNAGSKCGSAVAPTSTAQVFHFLLVTVAGSHVTVTPTDSLGNTFDQQTYTF